MKKWALFFGLSIPWLANPLAFADDQEGQILLRVEAEEVNEEEGTALSPLAAFSEVQFELQRLEYLKLNLEFYQMIVDSEGLFVFSDSLHPIEYEEPCEALHRKVQVFIANHEARMRRVVASLADQVPSLSPEQLEEWSQFYAERIYHSALSTKAERILHACLYKFTNLEQVPLRYRFDRTMRQWYTLHVPLMLALIGDVK